MLAKTPFKLYKECLIPYFNRKIYNERAKWKKNWMQNSPHYDSHSAILENTNTKMQRDLIAHTA